MNNIISQKTVSASALRTKMINSSYIVCWSFNYVIQYMSGLILERMMSTVTLK